MGNPFKRIGNELERGYKRVEDDPLRALEDLGTAQLDVVTLGYRKEIGDALGLRPEPTPDLPPVPQELTPEAAAERISDYQSFIGDVARRRGIMQNQTQGFQSQVVAGQSPALTLWLGDYLGNINT